MSMLVIWPAQGGSPSIWQAPKARKMEGVIPNKLCYDAIVAHMQVTPTFGDDQRRIAGHPVLTSLLGE
jgi:hypothetical protein